MPDAMPVYTAATPPPPPPADHDGVWHSSLARDARKPDEAPSEEAIRKSSARVSRLRASTNSRKAQAMAPAAAPAAAPDEAAAPAPAPLSPTQEASCEAELLADGTSDRELADGTADAPWGEEGPPVGVPDLPPDELRELGIGYPRDATTPDERAADPAAAADDLASSAPGLDERV